MSGFNCSYWASHRAIISSSRSFLLLSEYLGIRWNITQNFLAFELHCFSLEIEFDLFCFKIAHVTYNLVKNLTNKNFMNNYLLPNLEFWFSNSYSGLDFPLTVSRTCNFLEQIGILSARIIVAYFTKLEYERSIMVNLSYWNFIQKTLLLILARLRCRRLVFLVFPMFFAGSGCSCII